MMPGSSYIIDNNTFLALRDLLPWIYSDPMKYDVLDDKIMNELCISKASLVNIAINKPGSIHQVRLCFKEEHITKRNILIGIQILLRYEPYNPGQYADELLLENAFSERFSFLLNRLKDLEVIIIKIGHSRREEEYLYGDYDETNFQFSFSQPNLKVLHLNCGLDFSIVLDKITATSLGYLEINTLNFPYFLKASKLQLESMKNLKMLKLDLLKISPVRETP